MQVYDVKPDSTVFFQASDITGYNHQIDLACSSRARPNPDIHSVLHWATEFQRGHDNYKEHEAKRQLFRSLVSGLYQRRALGFPNHFVFGTAHHSTTILDVFAATWNVPEEGQDLKAGTSGLQASGSSNVPYAGQRGNEGAEPGDSKERGEVR